MKKALTIAGSDSGGGAGIQQDLKVFSALKVHGTSVITAITAQNTLGVQKIEPLSPKIIESQIDSVMRDIHPEYVKTGLLHSVEVIGLVRKKLRGYKIRTLVVDPVMVSSSGYRFLEEYAIKELRKLMAVAQLSTPNIQEAEVLTGIKIRTQRDMEKAAETIGGSCLVKGGHLDTVDILFHNGKFHRFKGRLGRIDAKLHGSGCALSAAITANLAQGFDLIESIERAKSYIEESISRNFSVGGGMRLLDTGGIRLGRSYAEPERRRVIEELEKAYKEFTSSHVSYHVIPQVGSNIVFALKEAKEVADVAGISGRIIRDREKTVSVGTIEFGGSSHIGRVVLTAMRFDPKMRAAMNVLFSGETIKACKKLGYSLAGFERVRQPADTKNLEHGTSGVIKAFGRVPDVIYDMGGPGKEAMIRLFGRCPGEVVGKALRIGEELE